MNDKILCETCNTEFEGELTCPNCKESENIFYIKDLINSHINYCPPDKTKCINLRFKTDLPIKCIKCNSK